MYSIKRFYNQNRRNIWLVIIIIAFLFIIFRLINTFYSNSRRIEREALQNNVNNTNDISEENNNIIISNSSATGETISNSSLKTDTDVITEFLENCNNGNVEEAYNMLTDECKEEMFSTVEDFRTFYYGNIFNGSKVTFEIENWVNDIYKVDIVPDMLSTGKVNNTVMQDYITVDNYTGEYKLNINNYISRRDINKSQEKDNVKITVNYRDTYMEYEEYNLTIENNGETSIVLDDLTNLESMYIEDQNEMHYTAYTHEITKDMLEIPSGTSKTIEIKYYSRFSSSRNIEKLVFSNVNMGKYNVEEEFKINI